MTVDPSVTPARKHTVGMIEKALGEVGFSVKTDKPAKAQALELIKKLSESDVLPIRRVRMRVRITMPSKDAKRVGDKVKAECEEVEEEEPGAEWEAVSTASRGWWWSGLMVDRPNQPQRIQVAYGSGQCRDERKRKSRVDGHGRGVGEAGITLLAR